MNNNFKIKTLSLVTRQSTASSSTSQHTMSTAEKKTNNTFETERDFDTLDWVASALPRIAYAY